MEHRWTKAFAVAAVVAGLFAGACGGDTGRPDRGNGTSRGGGGTGDDSVNGGGTTQETTGGTTDTTSEGTGARGTP